MSDNKCSSCRSIPPRDIKDPSEWVCPTCGKKYFRGIKTFGPVKDNYIMGDTASLSSLQKDSGTPGLQRRFKIIKKKGRKK